jgi:glycerol kinase
VIKQGDIQAMSGTGIFFIANTKNKDQQVKFLQI